MLALRPVEAHILMSMRLDAVQVQRMLELRPAGQAHRLMVVGLDAVGLQRRDHWLAMRQNIRRYCWLAQMELPAACPASADAARRPAGQGPAAALPP